MNNKTLKRIIITDLFILLFLVSLFVPMTHSQTWMTDKESKFEKHDFDSHQISEVSTYDYRQKNNVVNGPMDSAWPMFGHDARHTGRSPFSTENNSGVKLWEFRTEYLGIDSSPAIDQEGIIYFGSNEHYLHALYPNGTEKWRADCGHWVTSSPAIAEDGTIYVGSWDDHFYAINPNGTIKWRFYIDDILGSPVIDEEGIIYFGVVGPGRDTGRVYALYPNGTEKWHFDTGFWIYTSPAIGEDGTVYIASEHKDNTLYALYRNNGTMKWSFGFGDWPGDPAIADDGTIYVASWDDYLYAIYPNGTLRWRHGIDWGTGHAPAIGSDGTIYIGEKYLYAVNPNGTRKWTFDCGESQEVGTSCSISSDGTIYIGTSIHTGAGGYIIAINPDGTEKWREWIHNERCHSTPAIAKDGTIYIGTSWNDFGVFYAFGEGNRPPDRPMISGETDGKFGESYEYTFVSSDYEEGEVWYYIDWGDEEFEDWFGPYDSGEEVVLNHTWDERGAYSIAARARDEFGAESYWGYLEVEMPVNQHSYSFPLLQRLLERFPNAFPILRYLIGL